VDKLRLKCSALKAQIVTLEAQRAQKEEACCHPLPPPLFPLDATQPRVMGRPRGGAAGASSRLAGQAWPASPGGRAGPLARPPSAWRAGLAAHHGANGLPPSGGADPGRVAAVPRREACPCAPGSCKGVTFQVRVQVTGSANPQPPPPPPPPPPFPPRRALPHERELSGTLHLRARLSLDSDGGGAPAAADAAAALSPAPAEAPAPALPALVAPPAAEAVFCRRPRPACAGGACIARCGEQRVRASRGAVRIGALQRLLCMPARRGGCGREWCVPLLLQR
jgi:hypothetical protein